MDEKRSIKLRLKRDTLRILTGSEMGAVKGAVGTFSFDGTCPTRGIPEQCDTHRTVCVGACVSANVDSGAGVAGCGWVPATV